MYNQRRYGSQGGRRQSSSRGSQESRYGRRDDNKSLNHENRNNSGPSSSSPPKIKQEIPQQSGQRQSEAEKQPENQFKYAADNINTEANEGTADTEGYQEEDFYVEADIVGFDDIGVEGQFSEDQTPVDDTSLNSQKKKVQVKQEVMENQEQFEHGERDRQQSYASGKGYESRKSSTISREQSKTGPRTKREEQPNYGDKQVPPKDNMQEDTFGIVMMNGKRFISLESLILPNEKKHSGRSRLFIANLANGVTEIDLKELFSKFGEPSEMYVNREKSFGFVRMDYRVNAETARNALDGYMYKGRYLKVKFAAHQSAIEIHGLDRFTSNEALEAAFSQFGAVERATVVCDERGKSKGYAVVEFAYKKAAQVALNRINEGLYVLGRFPKPVSAKPLSQIDEEGVHEKDLERVPGIAKDREYKARFVMPDTPEFALAKRWKELEEHERTQKECLERQLEEDRQKLEVDIEASLHEQEADYIRQELLQRQAALEEEIRRYDELRNRESMMIRQGHPNFFKDINSPGSEAARMQDEFIRKQQQELRRRQGNDDIVRGMQNAASNMGMGGINPAAALAMAASGNPAASAAAANILQAIKGHDQMGGGGQGMQRMPGPMGLHPRGMMGPGGMHPRPLFDGRQGQGRGSILAGARRPGSRDNPHNSKRPRK